MTYFFGMFLVGNYITLKKTFKIMSLQYISVANLFKVILFIMILRWFYADKNVILGL